MTSSTPSSISIPTVVLLLLLTTTVVITTAVPDHEYRSMLAALRYRGYHLFANAITTTDLHYDIITSNNNFTFFAPIDSALYALDMTLSAGDYTKVLRFHCVPHRITLTDLFYGERTVPSLVEGHEIHVVNPLTLRSPVMVEGVGIVVPGLFYGEHVAVHGLEGVMEFRSLNDGINSSTVSVNLTKSESIEIISESITQPREEDLKSELISEKIHDVSLARISIGTGITVRGFGEVDGKMNECGIEEDDGEQLEIANVRVSGAMTGSELISERIQDVSLARKLIGSDVQEYMHVDDKSVGCSIEEGDGDGERLDVANVRRGDVYAQEVYEYRNMICVAE